MQLQGPRGQHNKQFEREGVLQCLRGLAKLRPIYLQFGGPFFLKEPGNGLFSQPVWKLDKEIAFDREFTDFL